MPRRLFVLPLAATALVLVAACGSSSHTTSSSSASTPATPHGSITVFAAASLTGSFTQLGKQFEAAHPGTTVKFSFAASSTLAQQINQGAPADVFASAATTNMQQVITAGGIASSSNFVSNTAELAVAPAKAATIASISDLGTSGVTFALCQVQVPCGALAKQVLDNAHVTAKPITQGLNVKTTLAYVTNGQVDAAIVYVTDVKAAGSSVVGVQIPASDNAKTEYPIGVVTASKNTALATAFEHYVESSAGQSVLAAAGFSAP
jgi:molybdate transport system substrate-binding protein